MNLRILCGLKESLNLGSIYSEDIKFREKLWGEATTGLLAS